MSDITKISASHLSRAAYVYLRQSAQVEHNRESTQRRYALVTKASTLGWPAPADHRDRRRPRPVRRRHRRAQRLLHISPQKSRSDMSASCSASNCPASRQHCSFEAEQQAIIEHCRMIDAIAIADERVGDTAEIEQAVPIGLVANAMAYGKGRGDKWIGLPIWYVGNAMNYSRR
jgi:hypothetical protein